jgi:hypothetical protein
MQRIKDWFNANWIWFVLMFSALSAFFVWLLFRKPGESAPPLKMPGKAEVEAAIEQQHLLKQREQQEQSAAEDLRKKEASIQQQFEAQNKLREELKEKTEREIADELDRRI